MAKKIMNMKKTAGKKMRKPASKKKMKKKSSKKSTSPSNRKFIEKPDKWDVRSSLDTLVRAEKIKKDKTLMGLIEKERKSQQEALNEVKKDM